MEEKKAYIAVKIMKVVLTAELTLLPCQEFTCGFHIGTMEFSTILIYLSKKGLHWTIAMLLSLTSSEKTILRNTSLYIAINISLKAFSCSFVGFHFLRCLI